jgi:hypothetical protein
MTEVNLETLVHTLGKQLPICCVCITQVSLHADAGAPLCISWVQALSVPHTRTCCSCFPLPEDISQAKDSPILKESRAQVVMEP